MARAPAQPLSEAAQGKPRRPDAFWLACLGVVLTAAALRVALLAAAAFPFNADEAIVGLMGRHILAGERPIFFYGQAYLGSLDAALVAAAFRWIGETVLSIRVVQSILFLGIVLTTMWLARSIGFSVLVCALAGLLLAVPPVHVTLYTTVSLGGYGEALLLGNAILLLTLRLIRAPASTWAYLLWGALAGFGAWVFGLTLIYSVPSGALLVLFALRRLGRAQTGGGAAFSLH